MNTMPNQLKQFREDRLSRILDEGTPQLLDQPLIKRSLAVVAVASSWITFATLLIATNPQVSDDFRSLTRLRMFASAAMAISFLLLRVSMRRVTSLPNEFLDERELANRDWAFRTGYTVIRRVGLALALMLISFLVVSPFIQVPRGPSSDLLWLFHFNNSLLGYVTQLVSTTGPVMYFAWVAFLLTYVAYSFPLVLLAWREAREGVVIQGRCPDQSNLHKLATRYFRKLWRVVIFGALTIASMYSFSVFQYGYIWVIFAWVTYGVYVYFWAIYKLGSTLIALRNPALGQNIRFVRQSLLRAFTTSAITGALIVFVFAFANQLNLNILPAFFFGFASVILHIYCFALVRRIAYMTASEKGN